MEPNPQNHTLSLIQIASCDQTFILLISSRVPFEPVFSVPSFSVVWLLAFSLSVSSWHY